MTGEITGITYNSQNFWNLSEKIFNSSEILLSYKTDIQAIFLIYMKLLTIL